MRNALLVLLVAVTAVWGADKNVVIGLVAKSQSNPVFQAAYAGAKDAAKELGPQYGVSVTIDWQTPPDEDAQKQAEAIEQLARGGAAGIAVSCSDANTCTPAINKAVGLGSVVVCFELAKVMGDKGTIALLAGNQTAPNLQKRTQGVKDELQHYTGMQLLADGVFYHPETPEQATEAVNTAQSTHPQIEGWAMIGGWPLFAKNALKWAPGSIKVVSVDALPAQLGYVKSGHVAALYAQDCYGWGYKSVQLLLEKIVKGQNPAIERVIDPLTRVTAENAEAYGKKWDKWLGK